MILGKTSMQKINNVYAILSKKSEIDLDKNQIKTKISKEDGAYFSVDLKRITNLAGYLSFDPVLDASGYVESILFSGTSYSIDNIDFTGAINYQDSENFKIISGSFQDNNIGLHASGENIQVAYNKHLEDLQGNAIAIFKEDVKISADSGNKDEFGRPIPKEITIGKIVRIKGNMHIELVNSFSPYSDAIFNLTRGEVSILIGQVDASEFDLVWFYQDSVANFEKFTVDHGFQVKTSWEDFQYYPGMLNQKIVYVLQTDANDILYGMKINQDTVNAIAPKQLDQSSAEMLYEIPESNARVVLWQEGEKEIMNKYSQQLSAKDQGRLRLMEDVIAQATAKNAEGISTSLEDVLTQAIAAYELGNTARGIPSTDFSILNKPDDLGFGFVDGCYNGICTAIRNTAAYPLIAKNIPFLRFAPDAKITSIKYSKTLTQAQKIDYLVNMYNNGEATAPDFAKWIIVDEISRRNDPKTLIKNLQNPNVLASLKTTDPIWKEFADKTNMNFAEVSKQFWNYDVQSMAFAATIVLAPGEGGKKSEIPKEIKPEPGYELDPLTKAVNWLRGYRFNPEEETPTTFSSAQSIAKITDMLTNGNIKRIGSLSGTELAGLVEPIKSGNPFSQEPEVIRSGTSEPIRVVPVKALEKPFEKAIKKANGFVADAKEAQTETATKIDSRYLESLGKDVDAKQIDVAKADEQLQRARWKVMGQSERALFKNRVTGTSALVPRKAGPLRQIEELNRNLQRQIDYINDQANKKITDKTIEASNVIAEVAKKAPIDQIKGRIEEIKVKLGIFTEQVNAETKTQIERAIADAQAKKVNLQQQIDAIDASNPEIIAASVPKSRAETALKISQNEFDKTRDAMNGKINGQTAMDILLSKLPQNPNLVEDLLSKTRKTLTAEEIALLRAANALGKMTVDQQSRFDELQIGETEPLPVSLDYAAKTSQREGKQFLGKTVAKTSKTFGGALLTDVLKVKREEVADLEKQRDNVKWVDPVKVLRKYGVGIRPFNLNAKYNPGTAGNLQAAIERISIQEALGTAEMTTQINAIKFDPNYGESFLADVLIIIEKNKGVEGVDEYGIAGTGGLSSVRAQIGSKTIYIINFPAESVNGEISIKNLIDLAVQNQRIDGVPAEDLIPEYIRDQAMEYIRWKRGGSGSTRTTTTGGGGSSGGTTTPPTPIGTTWPSGSLASQFITEMDSILNAYEYPIQNQKASERLPRWLPSTFTTTWNGASMEVSLKETEGGVLEIFGGVIPGMKGQISLTPEEVTEIIRELPELKVKGETTTSSGIPLDFIDGIVKQLKKPTTEDLTSRAEAEATVATRVTEDQVANIEGIPADVAARRSEFVREGLFKKPAPLADLRSILLSKGMSTDIYENVLVFKKGDKINVLVCLDFSKEPAAEIADLNYLPKENRIILREVTSSKFVVGDYIFFTSESKPAAEALANTIKNTAEWKKLNALRNLQAKFNSDTKGTFIDQLLSKGTLTEEEKAMLDVANENGLLTEEQKTTLGLSLGGQLATSAEELVARFTTGQQANIDLLSKQVEKYFAEYNMLLKKASEANAAYYDAIKNNPDIASAEKTRLQGEMLKTSLDATEAMYRHASSRAAYLKVGVSYLESVAKSGEENLLKDARDNLARANKDVAEYNKYVKSALKEYNDFVKNQKPAAETGTQVWTLPTDVAQIMSDYNTAKLSENPATQKEFMQSSRATRVYIYGPAVSKGMAATANDLVLIQPNPSGDFLVIPHGNYYLIVPAFDATITGPEALQLFYRPLEIKEQYNDKKWFVEVPAVAEKPTTTELEIAKTIDRYQEGDLVLRSRGTLNTPNREVEDARLENLQQQGNVYMYYSDWQNPTSEATGTGAIAVEHLTDSSTITSAMIQNLMQRSPEISSIKGAKIVLEICDDAKNPTGEIFFISDGGAVSDFTGQKYEVKLAITTKGILDLQQSGDIYTILKDLIKSENVWVADKTGNVFRLTKYLKLSSLLA